MDSDKIKKEALSDSSKFLLKLGEMAAENPSLFQPVVEIVRVGLSILEKPCESYNSADPARHHKMFETAANLFTGLNSALSSRSFRSIPEDIASLQSLAGAIYEWALVFYENHFINTGEVMKDKHILLEVCLQLAKLFQSFSLVQELADIMATTPGFITRITMLWIHSIWNGLGIHIYYQPTVISLSSHRHRIQQCLDCNIPDDIIKTCCSIILTQKWTFSSSELYPMDGPIGFVVSIAGFSDKFRHALVAKHAASWLCRQLSIVISKKKDNIDRDPLRSVELILTGLSRFGLEGPHCIVDMIDSDIISLLLDCALIPGPRCKKESVRLLELIAKFLLYRPIIPRVVRCLRGLDIESQAPDLVRDALVALKEVALLREKKIDWKNGHKLFCKMISRRLLDGFPPLLNERDRHFIYYIVEQDVRDNEEMIEMLKAEYKGPGVPFVEIDYDVVPRTIVIKTSEEFRDRELPEDHIEHVNDAQSGKIVVGFQAYHTTEELFHAIVTYPFNWLTIF
ncbi:uncharacterized protein EV420DRAFT_1647326 [Desarmillaria tabescens]|uniref:Uncharacterized protein n=1 Tax=Armillaria tabescens TaxID=1929756 RepID=A0AA39MVB9_ARMTA|nr:uncharacterized protein EV420DRAFT_1647326 [Desarmillaria tabescens]KAK0448426.1 hypothetical protein EV420DRAFT_1647326 [Desarmillaria tabescens]